MNYTKEQEQAIFLRDKNIMVSAGAGAGKTRVLVSRMAELIMDEKNPVEADRFLVMTFTNAAAAEMKERISLDLEERLAKDPENHYLRKQIRKIRQADISTVHSFCNHLIRTHYNELSIDPSFRIGEEGELFLLRQQAIEQLLEEAYASGRESFVKFAESYAPGKSDKVLEELVGDLYRFSRSFPNASFWFEKTKQEALQLAEAKEWDNSPAVMLIFLKAKKELLQEKEALSKLLKNIAGEEVPEKYGVLLQDVSEYVEALSQTESYNAYYMVLSRGSVPAFPRATKKDKEWADYEIVKEWHQEVKELLQKQKETVFTAPAEELQREAAGIYPLLEEYIVLAQRFEEIYLAYKKEKNVYDFDDLEHFALELLVDHYDEGGQAYPSETAKTLAKKYKMIFVDEYQDTNLVQETILEMLSEKDNNTLFTVGDVKQSIYRFRQARPDLFLRRNEKYHNEEEGVSIELRDNFRSAPGVLCFTNYVFSRLMERDFGGVDYNEETALRAGEGGPMLEDKETSELLFFVKDSVQTLEEAPEDVLTETALITKRIQELIEEGYHYGDIVILLRSGAGRMEPMAEFLEKNGIPVSCENKTGYFHTREITIILNYLSVVDNVYQDIPMASVMLSSIGGFTEEELTKLRILVREPMREQYTLYDLMCLYLQEGAEDVGVVVQNHLLKRNRQLPPLGGVKFLGQLLDQRRDLGVIIGAKIVAHAGNAGGGEEILGVAGGGCHQRGGVNIPAAHVRQKLPAVCGAVDVHVNADLFEGRLGGLGQQGQLLTGGVGQPADGQLHAVLFPDAVAVTVHPAGVFQQSLGSLRVESLRRHLFSAEGGEAVGERAVGRDAVAV